MQDRKNWTLVWGKAWAWAWDLVAAVVDSVDREIWVCQGLSSEIKGSTKDLEQEWEWGCLVWAKLDIYPAQMEGRKMTSRTIHLYSQDS